MHRAALQSAGEPSASPITSAGNVSVEFSDNFCGNVSVEFSDNFRANVSVEFSGNLSENSSPDFSDNFDCDMAREHPDEWAAYCRDGTVPDPQEVLCLAEAADPPDGLATPQWAR